MVVFTSTPLTGEGNIYWLSGCLLCFWISRSTASCGMDTCLTDVSVFGLESITSLLGLRTYLCLGEAVFKASIQTVRARNSTRNKKLFFFCNDVTLPYEYINRERR